MSGVPVSSSDVQSNPKRQRGNADRRSPTHQVRTGAPITVPLVVDRSAIQRWFAERTTTVILAPVLVALIKRVLLLDTSASRIIGPIAACLVLLLTCGSTSGQEPSVSAGSKPEIGWLGSYVVGRWTEVVIDFDAAEAGDYETRVTAPDPDGNRVTFSSSPSVWKRFRATIGL